jgi:hypothetical protein
VTEALEVCYDQPIDSGRFVFLAPDGHPIREMNAPLLINLDLAVAAG